MRLTIKTKPWLLLASFAFSALAFVQPGWDSTAFGSMTNGVFASGGPVETPTTWR